MVFFLALKSHCQLCHWCEKKSTRRYRHRQIPQNGRTFPSVLAHERAVVQRLVSITNSDAARLGLVACRTTRNGQRSSTLHRCFRMRLGGNLFGGATTGPSANFAEGVMWPPQRRTWTRTAGTSGARITSAEDKKSLKTVRSHAILSIPPSMLPIASGRRFPQRSGHGGPARTHADILIWRPPGRTWTRTGGTSGARMTSAEDKKSLKTVRSHAIPIILFQCFQLRLGRNPSAERPWGLARTHAEGVMWLPPERTRPRTGGTSGARSASAENRKSLKTVGSHAILNISFQCFRLRLGGDSLG